MRRVRTSSVVPVASLWATVVGAQGTAFLFTSMPTNGTARNTGYGYYALGYGDTQVSPRGELSYSRPTGRTVRWAARVGNACEYSRTNAMLARLGTGRATSRATTHANMDTQRIQLVTRT